METDHKPLETIFTKPLNQVPLRLQRMRLTLQYYNLTAKYKPGPEMYMADCLSRQPSEAELEENIVSFPMEAIAISDIKLKEYQKCTDEDQALAALKKYVKQGFPNDKSRIPRHIHTYWPYRDELHIVSELPLRSNRIVIPTEKRTEVLKQLHASHCGLSKMRSRAKDTVYWPSIEADIEAFAEGCRSCAENAPSEPKEPMISSDVPNLPWELVAADIFEHNGEYFQVVVDHCSFYFEILRLHSITSKRILEACFNTFSIHGIPKILRLDNERQYISGEFKIAMREAGVELVYSSPYHSQGNSIAERAVREAKKILRSFSYGSVEYYRALLNWRNSPRDT